MSQFGYNSVRFIFLQNMTNPAIILINDNRGSFSLNIYQRMWEISNILDKINSNYDSDKFVEQLNKQVEEISYFYNYLAIKNGADKTYFKPKKRPKKNKVAYFNLHRGYPKELYDGHWCYIVKDFKTKCLVAPLTSIKVNSRKIDKSIEMDIDVNAPQLVGLSRLHADQIRILDIQRIVIDDDHDIYDVNTPEIEIINFLKSAVFD